MSTELSTLNPTTELTDLDNALRELKRRVSNNDDEELVDGVNSLASKLRRVAENKIDRILEQQADGVDVDGRAFSSISTALEKIARAVDTMSKRKRDRIEEQNQIVHAELERIKALRNGNDLSDIAKIIFPYQGVNRKTASPVLNMLNSAKVIVDTAIDADVEEIIDEEEINKYTRIDVANTSDTNAISSSVAESSPL
jgi:hypothetical protein